MHTPNENDKEILVDDGITTHPQRIYMPFIKYFDDKDKDIPNSIAKLKKIYKGLIEK